MADEMKARIQLMIDSMRGEKATRLSDLWEKLAANNIDQLNRFGYENFKQTVALDYFTFTLVRSDASIAYLLRSIRNNNQVRYLIRHLPGTVLLKTILRVCFIPRKHAHLSWAQSLAYTFLTHLLWEYVKRHDTENSLARLAEPDEGNPPRVYANHRLISQDLANSLLEYKSITDTIDKETVRNIVELGTGSGRTAFVFLKLMPAIRYFVVDIPPALYIAERYLASQFPERQVFRFRPFSNYDDVKDELESSSIICLLPQQLELLPSKSIDLFINIDSFHEMHVEQVAHYFSVVERLTRGHFYFKEWKVSKAWVKGRGDVIPGESDYPIRKNWTRVYQRECAVQTSFFEALFKL